MRIALGLEYKGSNYHGWQRQPKLLSIQECVEQAISKVADYKIQVFCAGRTDVGVHAKNQVIHFDTNAKRNLDAWILGGNSNLPCDISIKWAQQVDNNFHARFSALARSYRYLIYNNKIRPAIFADQVTWHIKNLNEKSMFKAAKHLLGEHDFSSFRGCDCQSKTAMRNIHHLHIKRRGKLIILDIKANAFLLHMVRNIAGLLMVIGEGKQEPIWAREVLKNCDRRVAAVTAPAHGLYLTRVYYPDRYNLPGNAHFGSQISSCPRKRASREPKLG
jgi:tRNA pseudouridine38-40 synthase